VIVPPDFAGAPAVGSDPYKPGREEELDAEAAPAVTPVPMTPPNKATLATPAAILPFRPSSRFVTFVTSAARTLPLGHRTVVDAR